MIYFFCRKLRDAASYRQLHFNVIVVANWQQGHKQPFQLARPVASCNRFVFHGINVLQSLVPKQVIENTFFFFFNNYFGNVDSYPCFSRLVFYKHFIFVGHTKD